MANIIHIEKISFTYPEEEGRETFAALDGVTLDIEAGSFVAVLGHNGSGKSTLAKHMNAVLLPTGGKVYVDGMGHLGRGGPPGDPPPGGHGLPEPGQPDRGQRGGGGRCLRPENLGVPTEEIRRRVDAALKAVGMESFLLHAPHNLSGGQKQRIAIAGIIAMEPKCIVLDESTAMLDPQRPPGGAGHGPAAEPGEGHHHRPHHTPHERGRHGGPGGGDGWTAMW